MKDKKPTPAPKAKAHRDPSITEANRRARIERDKRLKAKAAARLAKRRMTRLQHSTPAPGAGV
jgi:hypothetical protein